MAGSGKDWGNRKMAKKELELLQRWRVDREPTRIKGNEPKMAGLEAVVGWWLR